MKVRGKGSGPNLFPPLKLSVLGGGEVWGMRGVGVKCIDIAQNSDWEGSLPALN